MATEEVYEIRVRPVAELSLQARNEVTEKLSKKDDGFLSLYKGFAAVTYVTASPVSVKSVDPIEGDFNTLFARIMEQSGPRKSSETAH